EGSDPHVLVGRELGEHVGPLEAAREAEVRQAMRWQSRHVASFEVDAALGGKDLAGHEIEECRLAGAIGPDDRMKRPGLDAEAHPVHRAQRAEVAGQLLDTKQLAVLHASSPPLTSPPPARPRCQPAVSPPAPAARGAHPPRHAGGWTPPPHPPAATIRPTPARPPSSAATAPPPLSTP